MTESEGYNIQAQQEKLPSRFIAEIKRDLFVTEGEMNEALWRKLEEHGKAEELGEMTVPEEPTPDAGRIAEGSIVTHRVIGEGEVHEESDTGSCKVLIESGKTRFLRSTMLELKRTINMVVRKDNRTLS